MNVGKISRAILHAATLAAQDRAVRLGSLTDGRDAEKYRATVFNMFETGFVAAIHEHLLALPELHHMFIRHEAGFKIEGKIIGAPKQVDLFLRAKKGGAPHMVEVGDFRPGKVHDDLEKLRRTKKQGSKWFLALFRDRPTDSNPFMRIEKSFARKDGLNRELVQADRRLVRVISVPQLSGETRYVGLALLQAV